VRETIRGYTDSVVEQAAAASQLPQLAAELGAVRDLVALHDDLLRVLVDPGVTVTARRAVVVDLLSERLSPDAMKLLTFVIEHDRAPEVTANLDWLVSRVGAEAQGGRPVGVLLGHKAAEERVDGYASAVLEQVDAGDLMTIEDELFRFARLVDGSEELQAALSSRAVPAAARGGVVTDLLRDRGHQATVRLATYATQVGRPRDYLALLKFLVDRVAAEGNRRLAEVRSAIDLDDTQRQHLGAALSRLVGHDVDVRVTVDPSVLGGFVAVIGDTVVDGSARHRLEVLKERLVLPEATITTGDRS
jgi:F-type H+-transporting ATPase subunit delta